MNEESSVPPGSTLDLQSVASFATFRQVVPYWEPGALGSKDARKRAKPSE